MHSKLHSVIQSVDVIAIKFIIFIMFEDLLPNIYLNREKSNNYFVSQKFRANE
jgi:hypothetical protein